MRDIARVVTERELVREMRRLTAGADVVRVAVAFCGEAAHQFFPESTAEWPERLQLLVDGSDAAVRRGLTNPSGLDHLRGLGAVLRSLQGLHAKVLIFDRTAAIVGSANLSDGSVTAQYQCGLLVRNASTVSKLVAWFDRLWGSADANDLTDDEIARLRRLWPAQGAPGPMAPRRRAANLPRWRGRPPDPPLEPESFEIGISTPALKETLRRFKRAQCGYASIDGQTCEQVADYMARLYAEKGRGLRTLYARRRRWDADDLDALFRFAFINGRAAMMFLPQFRRLRPARVAQTIEYLFEGDGDPFIRFEKVLASPELRLPHLGSAGLACLLHLWDPKQFAVLNAPVSDGLRKLGVRAGSHRAHRVGARYRDQCAAMRHLTVVLGLRNLSRADHFFDGLGKGHFKVARG